MIYFSEVVNKKVFTQDKRYVGRLSDLIFTASDKPEVTKIFIRDSDKKSILVPIQDISKINSIVTIKSAYEVVNLGENELFVLRNLLDKQIIDIRGNKIVRVNDVILQNKPTLSVSGVDIGFISIARWFGFEEPVRKILKTLNKNWHPKTLSWADIQPLELARGRVKLKIEDEKLERVRPEDLADHLEKTNVVNARKVLNTLEKEFAAEVISNLNINFQTAIFKDFSSERSAKVLALIDPDEAIDILLTIPEHKRDRIISLFDDEHKKEILYLLSLSKTPIGDLITPEYIKMSSDATVRQIVDTIKKTTSDFSQLNYVYLVNSRNQLVGVCNLHELLLANLDTPAYRFMTQNVIVIHLTTPEEIAIKKMLKYKLYSLPVVDADKSLLGIVTLDDIMEFMLTKML